jgi:hypothetical protein
MVMPTILVQNGFHFKFYSNENHEPPHVHVIKGKAEAKWWLDPSKRGRTTSTNKPVNKRPSDPIDRLIIEHGLRIKDVYIDKSLDLLLLVLNNGQIIRSSIAEHKRLKSVGHDWRNGSLSRVEQVSHGRIWMRIFRFGVLFMPRPWNRRSALWPIPSPKCWSHEKERPAAGDIGIMIMFIHGMCVRDRSK